MATSLLTPLLETLDASTARELASSLGDSEPSVSGAAECAVAALLGGLASQSRDPILLRRAIELAPRGAEETTWRDMVAALHSAGSPLIAGAKPILSTLFGTGELTVVNAISKAAGLGNGTTS